MFSESRFLTTPRFEKNRFSSSFLDLTRPQRDGGRKPDEKTDKGTQTGRREEGGGVKLLYRVTALSPVSRRLLHARIQPGFPELLA